MSESLNDRSPWVHTLEPDELAAMWERTRKIDPHMARLCAQWWESRTACAASTMRSAGELERFT
jgi:hypothetical protein